MYKQNSTPAYIMVDKFKVHSESSGYMLDTSLRNFRYSPQNSYLSNYFSTGKKFSTTDRYNDNYSSSYRYRNCVNLSAQKTSGGGWWFPGSYRYCYSWSSCNSRSFESYCGYANLNAKIPYYVRVTEHLSNITKVYMRIRPTDVKNYY